MRIAKKLIPLVLILSVLIRLQGNCTTVTADTTNRAFSFDLLPEINRDLKVCDLIKVENGLLGEKVLLLGVQANVDRQARQAAEKSLKKEKRKRIVGNVIRTIAEIAAVIVIIKIL